MSKYILNGEKVKLLRLNKGYTREEFCRIYNFSLSTLYKIENNKGSIQMKILNKLIDIFLIDRNNIIIKKI